MNKPSEKRLEAERIKLAEPGISGMELCRRLGVTSGTVWAWWHPVEHVVRTREWNKKNPEKVRLQSSRYYKEHREAILAKKKAKRRASKAQ